MRVTGSVDAAARRWAYVTIIGSTAGAFAAVAFASHAGLSRLDVGLFVGMYALTAFGVEGGLHRCFTHRAFRPKPALAALLGIAGCMAAQGPILFWASVHRKHHACADRDGDPHSPRPLALGLLAWLRGFWHAHLGWMFTLRRTDWARTVPDLLEDRLLLGIDRRYGWWVVLGLLLPAAAGWATGGIRGAVGGLLWGGFARMFVLDHVTWGINSLGHTFGHRPHRTRDSSRNLALLALVSAGGSWHNNHHARPNLAHNGHAPWQLDPTGAVIRLLEHAGLAEDVRYLQRSGASVREHRP